MPTLCIIQMSHGRTLHHCLGEHAVPRNGSGLYDFTSEKFVPSDGIVIDWGTCSIADHGLLPYAWYSVHEDIQPRGPRRIDTARWRSGHDKA
jgi:hypothetical protein